MKNKLIILIGILFISLSSFAQTREISRYTGNSIPLWIPTQNEPLLAQGRTAPNPLYQWDGVKWVLISSLDTSVIRTYNFTFVDGVHSDPVNPISLVEGSEGSSISLLRDGWYGFRINYPKDSVNKTMNFDGLGYRQSVPGTWVTSTGIQSLAHNDIVYVRIISNSVVAHYVVRSTDANIVQRAIEVAKVNTIAELSAIANPQLYKTAIVADSLRGGIFNLKTLTGNTVDNGIVFSSAVTGYVWVRQYTGDVLFTWFGGIGDGVTDNTALVNSTITTLSSKGLTNLLIPEGDFLFTGFVQMLSNVNIKGLGEKSIISYNATTSAYAPLIFNADSSCTVSNLKMIAKNATSLGLQWFIKIVNSKKIIIDNVTFSEGLTGAILIESQTTGELNKDITVQNCRFLNFKSSVNSSADINCSIGNKGVRLINNLHRSGLWEAVAIIPLNIIAGQVNEDIVVQGADIDGYAAYGIIVYSQGITEKINNVSINNVKIKNILGTALSGDSGAGIYMSAVKNIKIQSPFIDSVCLNTVSNSLAAGCIGLNSCEDITINSVSLSNSYKSGIYIVNCNRIKVNGGDISRCRGAQTEIVSCRNSSFKGLTLTGWKGAVGEGRNIYTRNTNKYISFSNITSYSYTHRGYWLEGLDSSIFKSNDFIVVSDSFASNVSEGWILKNVTNSVFRDIDMHMDRSSFSGVYVELGSNNRFESFKIKGASLPQKWFLAGNIGVITNYYYDLMCEVTSANFNVPTPLNVTYTIESAAQTPATALPYGVFTVATTGASQTITNSGAAFDATYSPSRFQLFVDGIAQAYGVNYTAVVGANTVTFTATSGTYNATEQLFFRFQ